MELLARNRVGVAQTIYHTLVLLITVMPYEPGFLKSIQNSQIYRCNFGSALHVCPPRYDGRMGQDFRLTKRYNSELLEVFCEKSLQPIFRPAIQSFYQKTGIGCNVSFLTNEEIANYYLKKISAPR